CVRAPLAKAEVGCGFGVSACELGSSLPILPDSVCCQFSSCFCWSGLPGAGDCCAHNGAQPSANSNALAQMRCLCMGMIISPPACQSSFSFARSLSMRRDASALLSFTSKAVGSPACSDNVFRYDACAPVIGSSPDTQSSGFLAVFEGSSGSSLGLSETSVLLSRRAIRVPEFLECSCQERSAREEGSRIATAPAWSRCRCQS